MNSAIDQIIKESERLRTSLDKGVVNIPLLKAFLVKVEHLGSPSTRKRRRSRMDKYIEM